MSNLLLLTDNLAAEDGASITPTPALAATMTEAELIDPHRDTFARSTGLADQELVVDFAGIANSGLVSNGDFEVDTAGWITIGTASIARVTSDARFGAACLQVTANSAGGTDRAQQTISNPLLKQGTNYTVAAWVKQTVGSGNTAHLRVSETGGAAGGGPFIYAEAADPANWTYISASGQIVQPDRTALSIHVGYNASGQASGDKLLVDGVQLFVGDSVPAFDRNVDYLVLARNNLTDAARLRLRLYSAAAAGGTLLADSGWQPAHRPGVWRGAPLRDSWLRLGSVADARSAKVSVSDPGNPAGYLQLGYLALGEALQLSGRDNIDWEAGLSHAAAATATRSPGSGALTVSAHSDTWREGQFALSWAQEPDRSALSEALRRLGQAQPFWLSVYPDAADAGLEQDHAALVRATRAVPMTRLRTRRTGMRFLVEEF